MHRYLWIIKLQNRSRYAYLYLTDLAVKSLPAWQVLNYHLSTSLTAGAASSLFGEHFTSSNWHMQITLYHRHFSSFILWLLITLQVMNDVGKWQRHTDCNVRNIVCLLIACQTCTFFIVPFFFIIFDYNIIPELTCLR